MTSIQTQIVTNPHDFYALETEWQTLLAKSAQNHLFATHAYLATWWKHLAAGAALRVIVVRDGDGIAAAAPMMIRRGKLLRWPVRRLEFIGAGWGYGAFILSRRKAECLREIMETLATLPGWDIISLGQVVADPDVDASQIARLMSPKCAAHEGVRVAIPYIGLRTTWSEYLAGRSLSFRRNLRNRSRKLQALGNVTFERVRSTDDAPRLMRSLQTVADRSWKAEQRTAISSDPHVFAFYSDLATRLSATGALDVSLLRMDDQPVAYIFGGTHNGQFFEIDIAFDSSLAKTSPGVLLRNCLLQELMRDDYSAYDFVSYFDYKKELTSQSRQHDSHVFYRRAIYPLVLRSLRSVVRSTMPRLMADYSDLSWGAVDAGA